MELTEELREDYEIYPLPEIMEKYLQPYVNVKELSDSIDEELYQDIRRKRDMDGN